MRVTASAASEGRGLASSRAAGHCDLRRSFRLPRGSAMAQAAQRLLRTVSAKGPQLLSGEGPRGALSGREGCRPRSASSPQPALRPALTPGRPGTRPQFGCPAADAAKEGQPFFRGPVLPCAAPGCGGALEKLSLPASLRRGPPRGAGGPPNAREIAERWDA